MTCDLPARKDPKMPFRSDNCGQIEPIDVSSGDMHEMKTLHLAGT